VEADCLDAGDADLLVFVTSAARRAGCADHCTGVVLDQDGTGLWEKAPVRRRGQALPWRTTPWQPRGVTIGGAVKPGSEGRPAD